MARKDEPGSADPMRDAWGPAGRPAPPRRDAVPSPDEPAAPAPLFDPPPIPEYAPPPPPQAPPAVVSPLPFAAPPPPTAMPPMPAAFRPAPPAGAIPPGALPPGALPPGAVPPGALPPGAVPPGALPPSAAGSGSFAPQENAYPYSPAPTLPHAPASRYPTPESWPPAGLPSAGSAPTLPGWRPPADAPTRNDSFGPATTSTSPALPPAVAKVVGALVAVLVGVLVFKVGVPLVVGHKLAQPPATLAGTPKLPGLQASADTAAAGLKKNGAHQAVAAAYGSTGAQVPSYLVIAGTGGKKQSSQQTFNDAITGINTAGVHITLGTAAPQRIGKVNYTCATSDIATLHGAFCVWSTSNSQGIVMAFNDRDVAHVAEITDEARRALKG